MGKQINYYMGRQDFLTVAQTALDYGCTILRREKREGKLALEVGHDLSVVTEHSPFYFFLPPGTATPSNWMELMHFCDQGKLVEAGYSHIDRQKKKIVSARLYVITGYYDRQGAFVPRNEAITELYKKLVRIAKKVAPYTELTDRYISTREETYLQEIEYKHKEYITAECLALRNNEGYVLSH